MNLFSVLLKASQMALQLAATYQKHNMPRFTDAQHRENVLDGLRVQAESGNSDAAKMLELLEQENQE